MNDKMKPKYNIFQNVLWMVQNAWRVRKRTLIFCVLVAVLEVLNNLVQLYIAPEILMLVEIRAPLNRLLITISFFTAALFMTSGVKDYINQNALFAKIEVRTSIIGMIGKKSNMTSFPNTLDPNFIKLRERAYMATDNNREAVEHIWKTLSSLLVNFG